MQKRQQTISKPWSTLAARAPISSVKCIGLPCTTLKWNDQISNILENVSSKPTHFSISIWAQTRRVVLPYIRHIGMCRQPKPKGVVFTPFWSENGFYALPIFVWNRVWFWRELREWMNVFIVSIPNVKKREICDMESTNFFCCCSNLSNHVILA